MKRTDLLQFKLLLFYILFEFYYNITAWKHRKNEIYFLKTWNFNGSLNSEEKFNVISNFWLVIYIYIYIYTSNQRFAKNIYIYIYIYTYIYIYIYILPTKSLKPHWFFSLRKKTALSKWFRRLKYSGLTPLVWWNIIKRSTTPSNFRSSCNICVKEKN